MQIKMLVSCWTGCAKWLGYALGQPLPYHLQTGDAVGIAKETARQLSLGTKIFDAESLGLSTGGTSSAMPASELYDFVEAADGFAEVFPEHKYRVVEILQQRKMLVGMTGDGVNDAPSLKKVSKGNALPCEYRQRLN